jgi:hypothetical protein
MGGNRLNIVMAFSESNVTGLRFHSRRDANDDEEDVISPERQMRTVVRVIRPRAGDPREEATDGVRSKS